MNSALAQAGAGLGLNGFHKNSEQWGPGRGINMSSITNTIGSYLTVYKTTLVRFWQHMTPQQYASLLIFVALVGFIAMRSKGR